ncbi:MAG: aminomethyltransferase family protein [Nitrospirae bacterium]|nr:aminomethyltransferase family protein [Nitrospirota bacterium]
MKQSSLQDLHHNLSATFLDVGEWSMPAHYGDAQEEHLNVRKEVGIADLSHRGTLVVTGDDRVTWLQSIISNDILPLQSGQGRYSSFMSHKGKILSYFRVYVLEDHLLVEDVGEVGDATFQTFRKFLLYGTKAKMKSRLDSWGILLVSGPSAGALIQATLDIDAPTLEVLGTKTTLMDEHTIVVSRTEETGETDFEIFAPHAILPNLWDRLTEKGQSMGIKPFGTTARESLRIEAGLPQLGPDLNESIVPPEANLEGKAFSLTKGCYPGQEVVARMDTYGSVKRRLVGLVVEGTENQLPEAGAKIFSGEREVGWISSSAFSPTIKKRLALGFPLRDFTKPDTELTVDIQGQLHRAVVQALPFVGKTS